MLASVLKRALVLLALTPLFGATATALPSTVNFVVLRVTFPDFPSGTRFTTTQTKQNFASVGKVWGNDTSYGNITLKYQFAGPLTMPHNSSTYLDAGGGNSSTNAAMLQLLGDAIAAAPNTINWSNVYGVVVLFADNRVGGFYRGITWPGQTSISPSSGSLNVYFSIVGENPGEDVARTWGRWAHEMGHQMQANPGNPWHPSNYNSDFEQMDGEYPAQSGVFFKQATMAFPGWLPPSKYLSVNPPTGESVTLFAEERRPGLEPDYQAAKAFLTFGGSQVYYLVSVRHHILGDDLATTHGPNGIPDEGVLIERVVEGGDPNIDDCPPNGCFRWVTIKGNGNADTLWHEGDEYQSASDGIFIAVRQKIDDDHYSVFISYSEQAGKPDVGINPWLSPPGNTYETTDIWIDSPVNGFGVYRYPMHSDLMGGTVPSGNGDDPAVGLVNRLYARVRNYGGQPATNVVVHFDITDPPGLGINGSNGFVPLGTVTSADFPGLASIPPGGTVDVYLNWTPNFNLTPQQIADGIFYFHTCVRVRIDHVAGETFFGNQDGNGEQENIEYFQAGSPTSPGMPGPANKSVIHLRNDSASISKQFTLSLLRESLPDTWRVKINGGNPIVKLGPGEMVDVPVVLNQTAPEPVGTLHTFRVYASSQLTLKNAIHPQDLHNEMRPLGGVQLQAAVLRKTHLTCKSAGDGTVMGQVTGPKTLDQRLRVLVVGVDAKNRFVPTQMASGFLDSKGRFTAQFPPTAPVPKRAVCLFAGTTQDTSAGTDIFMM